MFLLRIYCVLAMFEFDSVIPTNSDSFLVYPRFDGIQAPNQFPAKISEQDLQKYDNLFVAADTNQDNLVDGN